MGKTKAKVGFKGQLLVVFFGLTAVVLLPSTTLLFIGMMPTIAAGLVDRSRKKMKAVTVGAMNLAGCAPFLLELWRQGHTFNQALTLLSNPGAIVVMYVSAAVGYLVDWAVAGLVANIIYQKALARQKAIRERQKDLTRRWGPEVTGEIALDPQGFPIEAPKPKR